MNETTRMILQQLNTTKVVEGPVGPQGPKGDNGSNGEGVLVYATLSELQSALPSGSDKPVWVTADNSWYYWNGGSTPPDTTAPTVSASPSAGTYASTQSVTLSANETATIYYTLDGSTPTISSSVYSTALSISSTSTLKYFAKDMAGNASAVQTQAYTITAADTTAPTVTASPAAGTFTTVQSVTLSANETATIYYTTDGSTPTTSSTPYSAPIAVNATTTLKYFGKDTAGNSSTVQTATYTINLSDTTAPNPVTALTAGTPTSNSVPLSWTLSSSGDVSKQEVAYSTDGTNFTVASAVVSAASNSYSVTGLTASTAYTFRVVVIDTSNNRSTAVTTTATTAASGAAYVTSGLLRIVESPAVNSPVSTPSELFGGTGEFTFSTTVKMATNGATRNILMRAIDTATSGGTSGNSPSIQLAFDHKVIGNFFGLNASSAATWTTISAGADTLIDPAVDNHLVFVRDATTIKFYLNNVFIKSANIANTVNLHTNSNAMTIGGNATAIKNYAYYNRALTTGELTQNYNVWK